MTKEEAETKKILAEARSIDTASTINLIKVIVWALIVGKFLLSSSVQELISAFGGKL